MKISFENEVISWRGPAPYVFVPIPDEASDMLRSMIHELSYGWGVIPVRVKIGKTEWTTSIMPRKGVYLVPIKMTVQRAEMIEVGERVKVSLSFG